MSSDTTMERYLSIADLSRMLGLPESTTRYYCKRFADHLPHAGEGRKRRYAPESVDILRTVMEEMRRSKNAFAVDLALNKAAPVPQAASPVPVGGAVGVQVETGGFSLFSSQVMSLMERQTSALQEIAAAMTLFASHHPAQANDENERLKGELEALKDSMRDSAEAHKKDLEQTRKWLARFSEALAKR